MRAAATYRGRRRNLFLGRLFKGKRVSWPGIVPGVYPRKPENEPKAPPAPPLAGLPSPLLIVLMVSTMGWARKKWGTR